MQHTAPSTAGMTQVKIGATMPWGKFEDHPGLHHREVTSAQEADGMNILMSSILWEKIDVGGAVLPHYHNVAEIIHITKGKVRLYLNGEWHSFQAGDTFLVPAGVIHSVRNDDAEPTEQLSIFVPTVEGKVSNEFFKTTRVDIPLEVPIEGY